MTTVAAPTGPDILSHAFDADPYPFYAEMRESHPLYHHEVSGFWMVSRYHETFRRWVDLGIEFQSNFAGDPHVERRGLEAQAQFADYLTPIITERRADPGEDLLSKMLLGTSDGISMEDWEVRAFTSLLVSAGGETTDNALASMVCRLLENPEQLEAVRRDRSLITAAMAETLRHSGPVQMIMRQAERDVELSGGVVPAGGTVACVLGAANRDPERFENPDTFDVLRRDLDVAKAFNAAANHVEFALGRHICVGAHLSRVEVEVAMDALLDRLPEMSFAPGFEPDETGVFTRGPRSVDLVFRPAA